MKKVLFTLLFVGLATLAASAQSYVGGTVNFTTSKPNIDDNDVRETSFTIAPEFGRELNDKWSVGIGLGFSHLKGKDHSDNYSYETKQNAFNLSPYARYSFVDLGRVRFFTQGGVSYTRGIIELTSIKGSNHESSSYKTKSNTKSNTFSVNFHPGIKFSVCDRIDLLALIGDLGYYFSSSENADGDKMKSNAFQCSFSTESISLGAIIKI